MAIFLKKSPKRNTFARSSARGAGAVPARRMEKRWRPVRIDKTIALIAFVLMCGGLIFTLSSSGVLSTSSYFQRQLMFDIVGLGVALVLSQYYMRLQRIIKPSLLLYLSWVFLIIVLFMPPIANVHRWINLGFVNFQPSEFAKIALVIYLADSLSQVQGRLMKNWKLLIKPVGASIITLVLIERAPDLGTAILMGTVMLLMLFISGATIKQLSSLCFLGGLGIIYKIYSHSYRLGRVLSFLNPEEKVSKEGYQLMQSFMAVGSGGWFGKGLGNSELKLEYLPAAHTDFIFSIMCEEIGLVWVLIPIFLFSYLLVRGVCLAIIVRDSFRRLLLFGFSMTICLQAFFNMSMAIGLLPTKGIALPFFSYGGSSAVMTLAMIGIMLNAAGTEEDSAEHYEEYTDYKNRNR